MTKKFGQQLLQHLDIIKPILLLDTSVVRIANQKFKDHATKSEIDEFELSYKDVGAFFPTCLDQLFPIVEMLSFPRKGQKPHVFLLDLLTVLIILIRGDLNEKARYLFDWYNFTATGLLTELEHSIFISRCSSCLHRIKLMGLIEITRDDSRYSALAARVKLDGPNLKFMPGLDFNEFCVWLRTSKESQVIFSFFKTFERLVDTFMALKKRTNAVHDIMEQKRLHGRYDIHVPRLDLLNPTEHDSGVNIVYSSSTHVSLCIDFEMDKYLEKEVYVKCECLRPTRVPFYDMPKTTYSRVFGNRDLPSLCCHKHYGLVSYQRFAIPLQWELGRCRMLKVDIQNLTPESKYVLEVYSKAHKYREISVQTLPLPEQVSVDHTGYWLTHCRMCYKILSRYIHGWVICTVACLSRIYLHLFSCLSFLTSRLNIITPALSCLSFLTSRLRFPISAARRLSVSFLERCPPVLPQHSSQLPNSSMSLTVSSLLGLSAVLNRCTPMLIISYITTSLYEWKMGFMLYVLPPCTWRNVHSIVWNIYWCLFLLPRRVISQRHYKLLTSIRFLFRCCVMVSYMYSLSHDSMVKCLPQGT